MFLSLIVLGLVVLRAHLEQYLPLKRAWHFHNQIFSFLLGSVQNSLGENFLVFIQFSAFERDISTTFDSYASSFAFLHGWLI